MTLCVLILNVIDNKFGLRLWWKLGGEYDILPILQYLLSLKMDCTKVYYIWYIAFIERYFFLLLVSIYDFAFDFLFQ